MLQLNGREERSTVVKRTLHPSFGMGFVFAFDNIEGALADELVIEVWDQDEVKDNVIGRGSLRFVEHRGAVEKGDEMEMAVPVEYKPAIAKAVPAGEVFFRFKWEARAGPDDQDS